MAETFNIFLIVMAVLAAAYVLMGVFYYLRERQR